MQSIRLENLLLLDIETVPCAPGFEKLTPAWQQLWHEKIHRQLPDDTTVEQFYQQRAGIMAEFAKIICISMAYFRYEEKKIQLRIKSFYGDDEADLLTRMLNALSELEAVNNRWCFTGHNIKEFDIPFLCRRLLINDISIPWYIDFQNMKPWEVNVFDTFQYWRFGDHKNFTSLNLLAAAMDVPSPTTDIDSTMVAKVFYEENDLQRIVNYCEKNVLTIANVVRRFKNLAVLTKDEVVVVK